MVQAPCRKRRQALRYEYKGLEVAKSCVTAIRSAHAKGSHAFACPVRLPKANAAVDLARELKMGSSTTTILTLSEADVLRLVDPTGLIEALAGGFRALSAGKVQAPPRPMVSVPGKGFTMAMLAWEQGQAVALKTVSVFHDNHKKGLPSHQAIISLFDPETGAPIAIMDGKAITGLRTAAGAILTVRELARPDARIATVIGGGVQAHDHVRMLGMVRDFAEIRVVSRSRAGAEAAAKASPKAKVVDDIDAALATSDVVCFTTSSDTAVCRADAIKPGTHVTSVGYAPPGSELPLELIDRATVYVESKAAYQPAPVGCAELAGRDASKGIEVGELLSGTRPGRTSRDQITLYKSMGNAMEDMIAANVAYQAALKQGVGNRISL
jgi:ornithine cyclodeaminase/thiomorpholine-carboxylate dehydrogenase